MAKLLVTNRYLLGTHQTTYALKNVLPEAHIRRTRFRGILVLECEGDALELARKVNRECASDIGRAVPVLLETESELGAIERAAVEIGSEHVRELESFCFRLHKRGSHRLAEPTPEIERKVGGAIWADLKRKYGREPRVELKHPDVTVVVEVLGPKTAVGLLRKAWREEIT